MCHSRLAEGEAPACAQACRLHAIRIITVGSSKLRGPPLNPLSSSGASRPLIHNHVRRYYRSANSPGHLAAADPPLAPRSRRTGRSSRCSCDADAVGCGIADKILSLPTPMLGCWAGSQARAASRSASCTCQPRRAVAGFSLALRKSWLRREARDLRRVFPLATPTWRCASTGFHLQRPLRSSLAIGTAALGVLVPVCSVMIYVDTRPQFGRFAHTAPRLFRQQSAGPRERSRHPRCAAFSGFALRDGPRSPSISFEGRALIP